MQLHFKPDYKPLHCRADALDERTSINIAYYTAVAMLAGTSKIPRAYTLVLNCLKHVDPEH